MRFREASKIDIPISRLIRFNVPVLKMVLTGSRYSDRTRHDAAVVLRTKHGYIQIS